MLTKKLNVCRIEISFIWARPFTRILVYAELYYATLSRFLRIPVSEFYDNKIHSLTLELFSTLFSSIFNSSGNSSLSFSKCFDAHLRQNLFL